MKPFIAIIGGRNSGKSTVIRSLTGCRSGTFVGEIEEHVHHTKIYVLAHSPQEKNPPIPLETIFQRVANEQAIRGIVIAIQPSNTRTRPSMEDTMQLAQQIGGFDFHTFIIDPPYQQVGQINVDDVQDRLRAIGITSISVVDGRRFSHLTARDTQQIAGLP
jgi:Tfp pilus assembly ATPase PilU